MMNLYDLKEIAKRQQEHIETHQRLIMAKEQRLKYLKQQSSSHQLHEQEKKRQRLKESISLQEMKLRRLKALRGQFHLLQAANTSSTTELESIRALFSEKEKELSVALAKVDALTRQLEELKNGNTTNSYHINGTITDSGKHNLELEKLRQELLYRNKLCETHSTEILQERNRVMRKQIELSSIDQRINELQQRLERKRLLNQQLSSQMHNNFTRSDIHPLIDNALYNNNHLLRSSVGPTIDRKIRPVSANIAAVEPLQRQQFESSKTEGRTHAYRDFAAAKQDPKYQTLPHNTKFGAKQSSQWSSHGNSSPSNESYENRKDELRYSFKYNESNRFVPDTSSNGSENKLAGKPFFEGPSSSDSSSPELSGNATHKDSFATRESYTSKDNWKAPPDNQTPGASHNGYQGQSQAGHHSFNKEISSGQSVQPTTSQYLQASDSIVPNNQSYNDISSTNVSNRHSSLNFTNSVSNYKPVLPPKPSLSVKPVPPPRQTPNASNTGQAELDSSKTNDAVDNAISLLKGGSSFENGSVTGRYSSPPAYSDCSVRHGFVSKSVQQLQGGKSSKQCSSLEQCEIESSSKDTSESITDNKNIENYERNPGEENLFNKTYKDSGYNDVLSTKPVADESKLGIHNIEASSIVHEQDDWHKSKRRPVVVGGEMEHALEAEIINGLDDISPVDDKPSISEMVHSVDVDSIDKALDASDFRQKEISPSSAECIQAEQENSSQVVSREDSNSEMSQMEASTTKTIDIGQASAVGGVRRTKSNLKNKQKTGERVTRRVSFDPLALLLDAALEGELELVKKTAPEVSNPSSANDEGITALHNAICARHFDVVKYLIEIGCDVNLPDSDGWTPLHCAASCNSLAMVKFLVEHGACIFATTISDHETAPEKCEEDEDGYEECTQYLYGVQEKLGILNGGAVYAVYDYDAQNPDELSFKDGDRIIVLRKGDDQEREWWWSKLKDKEGYVPRNLIGLYPRIRANREQLSNPSSSMEA